ncbi:MAG: hypothetical protein AAFO04_18150 [Cyanobacteria bacterium J06592_8]
MNSDLTPLEFSEQELDGLTGLSHESLTGSLSRNPVVRAAILGKIWKNRHKLLSVLKAECMTVVLSLVVTFPMILLTLDRATTATSDLQTSLLFLLRVLGLSVALTLTLNLGIWWQAKPLQNVLHLMDEVEKYNDTVKAVDILDQLRKTGNLKHNLVNREEVIQALRITRESLVSAFQAERILREHQDFIARRYELFAHLENNLTALMAFEVTNQANEYGQLLNETLQIGMSVHREMKKLQTE